MSRKIVTWLMVIAVAISMNVATAQNAIGQRANPIPGGQIAMPLSQQTTLGIEGNGAPILGIEGNGIMQRFDPQEFVLNDRLFEIGPRTVAVRIDQTHATIAQLGPGQIATVIGQLIPDTSNYAPREIMVDSLITAQLEALSTTNDQITMTLLGQQVMLRDFTLAYAGPVEIDEDDFNIGNHVKVHGWVQPDGAIIPTRVDKVDEIATVSEISGRVTDVDSANLRLNVGSLLVDYSSATLIYLSAEDLSPGVLLEIQGVQNAFDGIFVATQIRPLVINLRTNSSSTVDIQGVITSTESGTQFMLNEQTVITNELTSFDRGQASDVAAGRLVEVEGFLDHDDALIATLVRFHEEVLESEIRVYGAVQSIDELNNSVSVYGIDIQESIATRFDDKTDSSNPVTELNELNVGDIIEVRSFDEPDGTSSVLATRIRRVVDTNQFVRARVDVNQGNAISLLGLAAISDSTTEYEDINDNSITAAQFFAQAVPGTLVKVEGDPTPGAILATEMSIEEFANTN